MIYDVFGKLIKKYPKHMSVLDVSNIERGHYLLSIETDKNIFRNSIILK